jgi:hypothetical protein
MKTLGSNWVRLISNATVTLWSPQSTSMNFTVPTKIKLLILVAVGVAVLLGVNYVVTPMLVGENKLEAYFRPRGESEFDSDSWKRVLQVSA